MTDPKPPERIFADAKVDAAAAKHVPSSPQTESEAYKLAFQDKEFLLRQDLRAVRFGLSDDEPVPTLLRPMGCSACSKTGYKGRLALHEVMTVSEEIERLTVARASATEIAAVAREQGMTTLREDGMAKVRAGRTTIDEILRVVA